MEGKKEEEPDLQENLVINNKYQIQYKLGKGGFGKVYLVRNIEDDKKYAMKVLLQKRTSKIEIEEFYREIKILKELHNLNNSYFLNVYEDGRFITEDKLERLYFTMDYEEKGDLYHYVKINHGLGEKFGRYIFKKILKGIQFCHDNNYCHFDIKLGNILLNNKFNPIINDFGLSLQLKLEGKKNLSRFRGKRGTKSMMCPQMFEPGTSYNGLDADIFALGVLLFRLVTGEHGFVSADNASYNDIKFKNETNFWEKITKVYGIDNLTPEFKKLYLSMVAYNPKERPLIPDILLKNPWINELKKNPEEYKKLEIEYIDFMNGLEKQINQKNRSKIEIPEKKEEEEEKKVTRSFLSSNEKKYFINLTPKKIKDKRNYKYYIELIGYMNANDFMNSLINEIKKAYDDGCDINTDKEKLKFEITFINAEDEEEDDEVKEDEKEKNEKKEADEEIDEVEVFKSNLKECIMNVKLYADGNNEYLLCFEKNQGDLEEFYENFLKIKEIISKGNLFN